MSPSRMVGGAAEPSSSSGMLFQGDGQSLSAGNSQMTSNCRNSFHSVSGHAFANMGPHSGDVNSEALNDASSSGLRGSATTISGLSGGPRLQRNTSFNSDSHMLMARSPMDGPSIMPHSFNQDLGSQAQQRQANQATSSVITLPISRMGQVQMPAGPQGPSPSIQDPLSISPLQKKPRLEIKQEDILQQQALQQLSQRHDLMHIQNPNPQVQALMQQQRLKHHQQQLRQQFAQQGLQSASVTKRPYDGAVCSRRLMQYLYHQRQRPADNNISYWRKFVAEYYSPFAKKKWCLSLYENAVGVSHQALDAWRCEICSSRSGRGFAANAGILARLYLLKFNSGAIDEILFLGFPRESQLPSGLMMLEYPKAVLETVLEQVRVVHEGHLRVVFTQDLKILCWEFCARRHEEFLPRRLFAPQVNRFVQVAQSCQDKISESGPDGVSQSDLQAHNTMIMTAGRQLVRSLEPQVVNELGFPKRFGRVIQILEVVNCMKDLMNFCSEHKYGPIDGLKNFPQLSSPNVQMQRTEQVTGSQGLATDQITGNGPMALNHGINSSSNNNQQHMVGRGALAGSAQAALALTNAQQMRQNSVNLTQNDPLQQEASPSFSQTTAATAGMSSISSGAVQNPPACGFPSAQPMQHHSPGGNAVLQQNESTSEQGSQTLQQQRIHQIPRQDSGFPSGQTVQHNSPGGNSELQQNQSTSVQGNQALQRRRIHQMPQQNTGFPSGQTMQHRLPGGNSVLQQNQSKSVQQSPALKQQTISSPSSQTMQHLSPGGSGLLQQDQSTSVQGSQALQRQTIHQIPYQKSCFPSSQTMQHRSPGGNGILQQNQSTSMLGSQPLQQQRIHQMPQQDSGFSSSQTMQHCSPGGNGVWQQNESMSAQGSQASKPIIHQIPQQDSGFPSNQTNMQHLSPAVNGILQQNQSISSQGSQALQHMVHQLPRQDMSNKGESTPQHSLQQNQDANTSPDCLGCSNSPATASAGNVAAGNLVTQPASSVESPAVGNNRFCDDPPVTPSDLHLSDEFIADVANEFAENGFFDELDDSMSFWDDN